MRDHQENQRSERKKRRVEMKDKQAWMGLATACAAVALAVLLIIAFAGQEQPSIDAGNLTPPAVDNDSVGGSGNDIQEPVEEDLGMGLPIATVSVSNEFGFFYNQTIDCYYHHEGMDFLAEEGTEVLAVEDGVVESIYTGDILKGTEIVVDHGDGLKTLYRFVTAVDGLSVGDKVKQGEVIAIVAEATGDEYKDGAHLHFEIQENGKTIDPTSRLTFAEK